MLDVTLNEIRTIRIGLRICLAEYVVACVARISATRFIDNKR